MDWQRGKRQAEFEVDWRLKKELEFLKIQITNALRSGGRFSAFILHLPSSHSLYSQY